MLDSDRESNRKGFTPVGIAIAIAVVAALALILGGGLYMKQRGFFAPIIPGKQACTQEAKLCPDGKTYVGRTGPNCEFAACPNATGSQSQVDTSTWKTYRNEKYRFEVKVPQEWFGPGSFEDGPWSFTSNDNIAHGVGLPYGGMWIDIAKGICNGHDNGFEYEGPKPSIYERWTCQNNFQVVVGYWPSSGNRDSKNESVLSQILSTFKFIAPSAFGTGMLVGKVSIGPICPVETIPPEPGCAPTPETYASREFLVLSSDQKRTVASFHADAGGNYSVSLPPGAYVVVSAKTGIGFLSKDLPQTIVIKSSQTATLNIDVDTGIR